MPLDDVDPESLRSRFAYKPTERPRARSPPPANAIPRLPAVLTKDPQLARLTKCVCCSLRWTSSKSAKQKRTHIDQCAKKNALTKETVRILIEMESPAPQGARAPSKDATLMDSVIPVSPAKKFKRQHVVSTVRALPETRENILDKAREILGPTKALADPQPTQQFAQSALARRNAKRSQLLGVDDCMEEPPSTQPFAVSSLGMITTERATDSCEQPASSVSLFTRDSIQLSSNRVSRLTSLSLVIGILLISYILHHKHHHTWTATSGP